MAYIVMAYIVMAGLQNGTLKFDGVLFVTYTLLVRRADQIIQWLKQEADGDPLVVFDESHKAKNLHLLHNAAPKRQTRAELLALGNAAMAAKEKKDPASKTAKEVVRLQVRTRLAC